MNLRPFLAAGALLLASLAALPAAEARACVAVHVNGLESMMAQPCIPAEVPPVDTEPVEDARDFVLGQLPEETPEPHPCTRGSVIDVVIDCLENFTRYAIAVAEWATDDVVPWANDLDEYGHEMETYLHDESGKQQTYGEDEAGKASDTVTAVQEAYEAYLEAEDAKARGYVGSTSEEAAAFVGALLAWANEYSGQLGDEAARSAHANVHHASEWSSDTRQKATAYVFDLLDHGICLLLGDEQCILPTPPSIGTPETDTPNPPVRTDAPLWLPAFPPVPGDPPIVTPELPGSPPMPGERPEDPMPPEPPMPTEEQQP